MRLGIVLLVLIGLAFSVHAESPTVGNAPSATEAPVAPGAAAPAPQASSVLLSTMSATNSLAELVNLKEQNRIIQQYHSSLLDTVYWTLGVICGVAILLVGSSWLINFKLYEADKAHLVEAFELRIEKLQAELGAQIASSRTEMGKDTQALMEGYVDRSIDESRSLRSEWTSALSSVNSRLESFDGKLEAGSSHDQKLQRQLDSLEATLHAVEAHVWELKKNPLAVIVTHCQTLDAACRANQEWRVTMSLNKLIEDLTDHFLAKNVSLTKFTADLLNDVLPICQKFSAVEAVKAMELLKQIRVDG